MTILLVSNVQSITLRARFYSVSVVVYLRFKLALGIRFSEGKIFHHHLQQFYVFLYITNKMLQLCLNLIFVI